MKGIDDISMYTQAMLAEWLKDIIITFHPGNCELTSDGGIVLLTGAETMLSSDYLYVGSAIVIQEFFSI